MVSYPLISRLGIKRSDHLFVHNSYAANTIWSGGDVLLAHSATYIPYPASLYATQSTESEIKLFQASGSGAGNGVDVIERDFNLASLSEQLFFENFLNESAFFIKRLARDNSLYFSAAQVQDSNGKNGVIWLGDGNQQITLENVSIGKPDKPVIMIVDTSSNVFTTRGDISLYGLLYIRGDWFPTGQITVYGAVIVEGNILATENPELVNTRIYYQPDSLKPVQPITSTMARVMGSWKDF